jgi:hypothetical protein
MIITTLILTSTLVFAGQQTEDKVLSPQATKMEPRSGKAGTVVTILGMSLGKEAVDEVYLTDHRFDLKVKVLEQTGDKIKIRIPPFVKPGRQQLLFLTTGKNPIYLEQPIWVQVEEAGDDKEVVAQKETTAAKEAGAGDGNKPDKPEDRP